MSWSGADQRSGTVHLAVIDGRHVKRDGPLVGRVSRGDQLLTQFP